MEPYKKTVDEWLRADLEAPSKQRHTAKRIGTRMEEEFGVTLPYTTVRDFVTARRRASAAEEGVPTEGYLTRHNVPGADAEVDFGEVWIDLAGERVKCFPFAFRLAYSGRSVHRISRSCGQQAFFEGHVHALTALGGVPAGQVRYDNLTPAVRKVVFRSRLREENPKWKALREFYGFTAFYCEPGLRGAHEKGGVEGQVGYFRRNYLPLGPEGSGAGGTQPPTGPVRGSRDRSPPRIADPHDRPGLRPGGAAPAATAGRSVRDSEGLPPPGRPLQPDHGEDVLVLRPGPVHRPQGHRPPDRRHARRVRWPLGDRPARRPRPGAPGAGPLYGGAAAQAQALDRSEALHQARAEGTFTAAHEAFWAVAKQQLSEDDGTTALVRVLLLHRHQQHADVIAGLRAAV